MSTLYLAIKLFEPIELETSLLADLSQGYYSSTEIAKMESEILFALEWRLQDPTIISFVRYFVALMPRYILEQPSISKTILDLSTYQAEIAVCDYSLSILNPSTVAFAAILNVLDSMAEEIFPASEKETFYDALQSTTSIDIGDSRIQKVRQYLNSSFEIASESKMTDLVKDLKIDHDLLMHRTLDTGKSSNDSQSSCESSPVSVARRIDSVEASSYCDDVYAMAT